MSHVSRYWRAVALSTPSLWSHVLLTDMEVFTAFLSRSQRAPLALVMPLGYILMNDERMEGFELAARVAPRLQEFQLEAPRQLIRAFCDRVNSSPDLLQRLVLAGEDNGAQDLEPWEPILRPLRTPTRHLRHLELYNLPVQWSDPVFRSPLTTLVVDVESTCQCTDEQPPRLGTFEQLWTVLARLAPTLEVLRLMKSLPPATAFRSAASPLLFPRLRDVSLGGDVVKCTALLERMSFPTNTELRFDPCTATLSTQFNMLVPSLVRFYPGVFDEIHIEAQGHANSCLELDAYIHYTTGDSDLRMWDHLLELKMFADHETDDDQLTLLVREAPALFSNVRTLIAPCFSFENASEWEWFFENVPELRHLALCYGDAPRSGICAALGAVRPSTDGGLKPLLPKLTTLRLCEIDFDEDMSEEETRAGTRTRCASELVNAVRARAEHGVPLSKVVFIGCMRVTAEDVARMREFVQEVKCEEGRQFYSMRYMLADAVTAESDGDE